MERAHDLYVFKQAVLWAIEQNDMTELVRVVYTAIANGHVHKVKMFMHEFKDRIDINRTSFQEKNALMIASEQGHVDLIHFLLEQGASPNMLLFKNRPLHCAIRKNQLYAVKILIAYGADPTISVHGYSALMYACITGRIKIVEYLLCRNKNEIIHENQYSVLILAVKHKHADVVLCLIRHGALENKVNVAFTMDLIIKTQQYDYLKLLLDHGIDVNYSYGALDTPLIAMVKFHWVKGIQTLLMYPVNLNAQTNMHTALIWAVCQDCTPVVRLLVEAGANIEIDVDNYTALTYACYNGNFESVECLLEHGARVRFPDMLVVCKRNRPTFIPILLRHGANPLQIKTEKIKSLKCRHIMMDAQNTYQCTPNTLDSHLQHLHNSHLDMVTWKHILPQKTAHHLQTILEMFSVDMRACYTALYEGEDHVLKKYRQGEKVIFSSSLLRGIVRPWTGRPVRKKIASYLVYSEPIRTTLYKLKSS